VNAFRSPTEKMIMYPCRSGALINGGVFLPTSEDEEIGESSWLNSGQHGDLMAAVQSYSPGLRAFCSLGEDVKLWSLATRDPPRSFFKGKLALIGDAAHPMLPRTYIFILVTASFLLTCEFRPRARRSASLRRCCGTRCPLDRRYHARAGHRKVAYVQRCPLRPCRNCHVLVQSWRRTSRGCYG
jgi:hypothetical protein